MQSERRQNRNDWQYAERTFLLFLKRAYTMSWTDCRKVFNRAFNKSVSSKALISQYYEMKRLHSSSYQFVFEHIQLEDIYEEFDFFNELLIRASKNENVRPVLATTNHRGLMQIKDISNRVIKEEKDIRLLSKPPSGTNKCAHVMKKETTTYFTTVETFVCDNIPPLLFRVWDSDSQGANSALGFQGGLTTMTRPLHADALHEADADFLIHAQNHFNRKNVPTPFISLTSSFIWAIVLAIKRTISSSRGHNNRPIYISVIKGTTITATTRLYEARKILKRLKEKRLAKFRYKGMFEFLAFGIINSAAMIGTFDFSELQREAERCPELGQVLRLHKLCAECSKECGTTKIWRNLPSISMDENMFIAVTRISRLVAPITQPHHSLVRDLIEVLVQNFNIVPTGVLKDGAALCGVLEKAFQETNQEFSGFACVRVPSPSINQDNIVGPTMPIWLWSPYD